jgi:dTDP-4-amino-4,6-dideoxygalactose transaminase
MSVPRIPFNRPHTVGTEFEYISQAIGRGHLSGNGAFTTQCSERLVELTGAARVLLTPSCTAALEMMALLAEVEPGDEVIMPSFTFVTTANAFVLRGAVPVFVDVRPDTLNLDERLVEAAITERTKGIMAVHYAGVGCDMAALQAIADRHGLLLFEDAAQGILSTYGPDERPLGGIGDMGALSFHETKNVTCGEGGALLLSEERFAERAEILQEKGTNRSRFFRGQVDKYTWVDLGSSYLLSEASAAFLWAQLLHAEEITRKRLEIWDTYHVAFAELEADGLVRRPIVPDDCRHNAHMYYLLAPDVDQRDALIARLDERGVHAVFHYVPLHEAPAGQQFCRAAGDLPVTLDVSARLLRLPLWPDLDEASIARVVEGVLASVRVPGGVS